MNQYTVTSPHFTGSAELLYNDDGVLYKIDLSNANMPAGIVTSFKSKAPALEKDIEQAFADTKALVVAADFKVTFDMFWEAYNMKRNKKNAEDLWKKLPKQEQVIAYYSIKAYDGYCARNKWYTKMYPDTFLRGKHFNDEWSKI